MEAWCPDASPDRCSPDSTGHHAACVSKNTNRSFSSASPRVGHDGEKRAGAQAEGLLQGPWQSVLTSDPCCLLHTFLLCHTEWPFRDVATALGLGALRRRSAQLSVFLSSSPSPAPWAWATLGLLAARGLCLSLLAPWLCSSGLVAIQSHATLETSSSGITVFPLLAEGTGIRLRGW